MKTFYSNIKKNSLSLKPLGKELVMKQLKKLSVHKATGPDKVSAIFPKDSAEILANLKLQICQLKHQMYQQPLS